MSKSRACFLLKLTSPKVLMPGDVIYIQGRGCFEIVDYKHMGREYVVRKAGRWRRFVLWLNRVWYGD